MCEFCITQVLSLGETTYLIARQLSGGDFEVDVGSMLGEAFVQPNVETARPSFTHEEPAEQVFVFTVLGDDQNLPAVNSTVALKRGRGHV